MVGVGGSTSERERLISENTEEFSSIIALKAEDAAPRDI